MCCGEKTISAVVWSIVCSERRINSKYDSLWESYQPQLAVFSVLENSSHKRKETEKGNNVNVCNFAALFCSNCRLKLPAASRSPGCNLSPPSSRPLPRAKTLYTPAATLPAALVSSELASLSPVEAGVRAGRGCMQRAASVGPASLS